jgi:hypothetical protein
MTSRQAARERKDVSDFYRVVWTAIVQFARGRRGFSWSADSHVREVPTAIHETRGQGCPRSFGCGPAAPRSPWLNLFSSLFSSFAYLACFAVRKSVSIRVHLCLRIPAPRVARNFGQEFSDWGTERQMVYHHPGRAYDVAIGRCLANR